MSRGRRKGNIRDISLENPSEEERDRIFDLVVNLSTPNIVVAILFASLLEFELERLIRPRFPKRDEATWKRMVSDNGPLATFHQKIVAAHALSICDDVLMEGFKTVKNIRNAFAHSKRLIDFENPLILKELKDLQLPTKKTKLFRDLEPVKKVTHGGKASFVLLCLILSTSTGKKRGEIAKRRYAKAMKSKRGSLYRSLLADALLASHPAKSQASLAGLFGGRYSADPKDRDDPLTLGDVLAEYTASSSKRGILG